MKERKEIGGKRNKKQRRGTGGKGIEGMGRVEREKGYGFLFPPKAHPQ